MQTAEQLRAARAMLQLDQAQVAAGAGVSVETIKRLERMKGDLRAQPETVDRLVGFFNSRGIDFTSLSYGSSSVNLISSRYIRMQLDIRRMFTDALARALSETFNELKDVDPEELDITDAFERVSGRMEAMRPQMVERLVRGGGKKP